MHNKNCCVESQLLSGQMHRECCYYCEVSMNALLGCFRGSRQLGQTLVCISAVEPQLYVLYETGTSLFK